MKILTTLFLSWIYLVGFIYHEHPFKPLSDEDTLQFLAVQDFEFEVQGFAPFYIDKGKRKGCLAINPMKYQDQWARAAATFHGEAGSYDLVLTTYLEYDGESEYQVIINQQSLEAQKNPAIDNKVEEQYHVLQWAQVGLKKGDKIIVMARSNSNKRIIEEAAPGGYGWSRARWKSLQLVK